MISSVKNPKLGYYRVGADAYSSKVTALLEGTRRNIHPEWIFNNEVFDRVDWTQEPAEDIYELYRQRAQQLRDTYSYLILMYSGGSDSQTILETCLQNNIHIDEIVVSWGLSLPYKANNTDYSFNNLSSEWDYTIRPRLDWIAKNHPEIKITVYDWAENVLDYKVEEGYIENSGHVVNAYLKQRWSFDHIDSVKHAIDRNNKVGIIRGTDKARICYHNGAYRMYFLDILTSNSLIHLSETSLANNVTQELFYWSPESCKILAKQAHMLVDFIESVPGFRTYVNWPTKNPTFRQWYESSSRAIIYPRLNLDFFQTGKPDDSIIGFDKHLFGVGLKEKVLGMTYENQKWLRQNIDAKYFSKAEGLSEFTGFITGMYPIKTVA